MHRVPSHCCLSFAVGALCLGVVADPVYSQGPSAGAQGGAAEATDWNRFRGPNGTGLATAGSYPAQIGPGKNVVWERPFPGGHSSPVFSAEHLFLTGLDGEKLYTYALDRRTGETVWKREAPRPRRTEFHAKNYAAAASAAVDDDTVVVFFDEFGMLAYDHSGEELWRLPMGPFNNIYGMASSPVMVDDAVVLGCDQQKGSFVISVAKRTGEVRWKIDRPHSISGHCTPVIYAPAEGNKQVILPGSYSLDAYDAETGERIWWINGLPSEMKSVPVLIGETLWIHGYGGPFNDNGKQIELPPFAEAANEMDKNGDGRIAREEIPNRQVSRWIQFVDPSRDGALDAEEWVGARAFFSAVNVAMALKVGGKGDVTDENVLWRYYRSIPQLPSPLIFGGAYYLLSDQGGLLTKLSAESGELVEKGRLEAAVDNYFASPVGGDGKVYILSESGILTVLAEGEGFEPIHSVDFDSPCYATPALVDNRVWLRTQDRMFCFGEG